MLEFVAVSKVIFRQKQYNKDWQQTDKKLQHGQKVAEQRMQKLEDEIFSRQSGRPATPPSYVPQSQPPPPLVPPPSRPSSYNQERF